VSVDKRPPDITYKQFNLLAPELQAAVRRGTNAQPPEVRPIIYDSKMGTVRALYLNLGPAALYTPAQLKVLIELIYLSANELKRDEDEAVAKLPKLCLKCFTMDCGGCA
jgi:hypothetical protein